MKCNGKCFECVYPDCIADYEDMPLAENDTLQVGLSKQEIARQKRLDYAKRYYASHKDKFANYRKENREKQIKYNREYYSKNKEHLKAVERDRIRLRRAKEKAV